MYKKNITLKINNINYSLPINNLYRNRNEIDIRVIFYLFNNKTVRTKAKCDKNFISYNNMLFYENVCAAQHARIIELVKIKIVNEHI